MGVVYLKTPMRTELNYHFVGVLHSATVFPTLTFSEFVFRYLGVPLTFAGSSWQLQHWQISHMMVPLVRTLHVGLEAYTSTTVHPHRSSTQTEPSS